MNHPAGENIAKVAGRDHEIHIIPVLWWQLHVSMHEVDRLGENANNVD